MEVRNMNQMQKAYKPLNCSQIMAAGSKSFYAASRLFPARLRGAATIIYTYCRLADDLIDKGGTKKTLESLRKRLDRIYLGKPANEGVDREFAKVVMKYDIPKELPLALLEGFEWDLDGKRYDNLEELTDYAARVAGSVGAMISVLMGVRDSRVLAAACKLGIAMQLTNIARDVGEDARNSRLYLPESWMRQVGLDPNTWLEKPVDDIRIRSLIKKLLEQASSYYQVSAEAIFLLPKDCRVSILSARYIYEEIGNVLKKHSFNSINHRAHVSLSKKLLLIIKSANQAVQSMLIPNFKKEFSDKSPLRGNLYFMLNPIGNKFRGRRCSTRPLNFLQRLDWVIDLLLKQAERDKYQLVDSRHPPRQ